MLTGPADGVEMTSPEIAPLMQLKRAHSLPTLPSLLFGRPAAHTHFWSACQVSPGAPSAPVCSHCCPAAPQTSQDSACNHAAIASRLPPP